MGYAKPSEARLIDQRARRRATQALIEAHSTEFRRLYEEQRRAAEVEAQTLAQRAAEIHPADEPPRLMSGRRMPGQDVTERIDVARCRHCATHHDRDHVCPECGLAPEHERPANDRPRVHIEDVEFLLDTDGRATWEHVAARIGVTKDGVYRALLRADRHDLIERLTRNALGPGVAS